MRSRLVVVWFRFDAFPSVHWTNSWKIHQSLRRHNSRHTKQTHTVQWNVRNKQYLAFVFFVDSKRCENWVQLQVTPKVTIANWKLSLLAHRRPSHAVEHHAPSDHSFEWRPNSTDDFSLRKENNKRKYANHNNVALTTLSNSSMIASNSNPASCVCLCLLANWERSKRTAMHEDGDRTTTKTKRFEWKNE